MALRTMAPVFLRKRDDDKAFERLYERHVGDVYRYAAAMLGTAADAEDVTQTTFLNAYRAFKKGTRPEKPQSWLMAIAHNVCRQRFRQSQRRPHEVAFDEGVGDGELPEDVAAPSAEDIRRALSELPPNQRAAIVMRELEGGSYAEIADVLGISVSALETLLFRARRSLREQLEEQLACSEAALAINRQIDGRLSLGERRALRAHLRACAECNSLAQSQRAQCRALKALVLVPLPATVSHWIGAQNAAAATGFAGAATGGGAAGTSFLFGGVAAKVAAVVVAGAVVGGGTYEGVTHAKHQTTRTAQPAAAHVEFASMTTATSATAPSARTFETPKVAAPILVTPSPRANPRALKAVAAARSRSHGATGTPPGQTVKVLAQTPQELRTGPPGLVAKATRAATPGSSASTPAATHSQKTTKQATGQSQGQSQRQSRSQRTTPSHPTTAQNDESRAKVNVKAAQPEHPATPPTSQGRRTTTETVPAPPETRGKKP